MDQIYIGDWLYIFIKSYRIDNSLPKSEGGGSLFPMPNRTFAMSTPMIHERCQAFFRPAGRFIAVDLRIDGGRPFRRMPREKAPEK